MVNLNHLKIPPKGQMLLFLWMLLMPALVWAQSGTTVTWNNQIACLDYGSEGDPREAMAVWEEIEGSRCIRVCEFSQVKYTVAGPNITNVQWFVSGGTLQPPGTQPAYNATVNWGNAGNGAVSITITYANGTQESATLCIEKIHGPEPVIGHLNQHVEIIRICKNTPVYFDNLSTNGGGSSIIHYLWDFGDGSPTSSLFEPSHSYTQAGTYEVTLSATNECNCTNSRRIIVEVTESIPVSIACKSVVCEGSKETYTANDPCGGEWEVIGGTIISNTGTQIEVHWDHVDPADGFGYVMYKSSCGCPEWTVVKIPVVISAGQIKGDAVICTDKQYKYSLPQWPTTSVLWSTNDPSVQLSYTPHRNEIMVKASQSGTFEIRAEYVNTLLGCEGSARFEIEVTSPVIVTGGADTVCTGSSLTFSSIPGGVNNWTVVYNNTTQNYNNVNGPFTHTFNTAGTYAIYARKPGGCIGDAKIVKAVKVPDAPTGSITGPDKVCQLIPQTYSLSSIDSGTIPVWEVTGGTIQGSNTGQSITVIFTGAGPFSVSVRNRSLDPIGCLSPPVTLPVEAFNMGSITVTPPSGGLYCPSSSQTFTANLNGIVPDSMEWTFSPSNFGSFVSGQGTSSVTVNFNEISANPNGVLQLKIVKCGKIHYIPVQVQLRTTPVIAFANAAPICPGSDLSFTVTVSNLPAGQSANVLFEFANGSTHPAGTVTGSGTYTFTFPNNNHISNPTGNNITQTVMAGLSGPGVCNYNPMVSQNFLVYPQTVIDITPYANVYACTGSTFQPYTLQANFSTGLTASSFFKWMKNGNVVAQGTNMTSFTITGPNPFGTYWVEVIDVNGCLVKSNAVSVIQDCGSTGGCTVTPSPNLSVTASLGSCNTINTQVTFTTAPSNIVWKLNGNVVPGTGTTNSITTTLAGVNVVQVEATYGSCVLIRTAQVIKPYQPKLKYVIGCGGVNPSAYTLTAHNISSLFGVSANAVTYSYQLTGGGQPPQNGSGQSAAFSGLTPGQTYQLTLTLTSPGLLPCSITESITLPAMPDMNFTLSPDPTGGAVCSESVITVNIPGYDPANTYYIGFNGTGVYATSGTPQITINNTVPLPISLTVSTPLGCVFTHSLGNIQVIKAEFSGKLEPPTGYTLCETSTVTPVITYSNLNSGAPLPSSYIWMNGDQPVPGAPNTQSFTPTQSGNYWPILLNANGCRDISMAAKAVPVTIKPVPYANIAGKANLCRGQGTILYGIVTEPNLEYQWTRLYNGTTTVLHPWSAATPTQLPTGTLNTAGTYTYTFHVRRTADPGCGTSVSFTITVSQPQDYPDIGMHIQCPDPMSSTPYSVELTIQNPQAGQYNWSSGQSGTTITVYHGGLYQVTHTAPSGCIVSSEIMVPHDLESLMWIFPTGCYDVCLGDRYIVGPIGDYNNHEWQYFGNSQQDGPGFIYPFWPQQAGNYQLMIDNGYCQFTSGTATLNPDPSKCKIRYECRIELHIEAIEPQEGGYYLLYGIIHNFGNTSVTFTITSMNGYGVYLPNTITIPAGGSYDFYANPLVFYPANGFSGGNDAIVFTAIDCEVIHELDFSAMRGIKNPPVKTVLPSFTMSPNPARSMVTVRYNTGHPEAKASMLLVHDAMGNVKFRKDLKSAEGEVQFDTSGWLQGVYIVTVVAPDKPLQGKLLKE